MSNIAMQGGATGTGTVTLLAPSTSTNRTLTLPDATGTVLTTATAGVPVNGPAFSAYRTSNQSITTSTYTKCQFELEDFDTNLNYDTSNYRFTPNVAGYYQVTGRFSTSVASTLLVCTIYKNGAETKRGSDSRVSTSISTGIQVSALVYLNGSTDYVELYAYITGTSPTIEGGAALAYFQAAMVRGA